MQTRVADRLDERGSALVGVLLLLLLMSALAAALAVSGRTETLIARNHQSTAQARAAAEAGLSHGIQAAVAYIRQFSSDDVPAVLDALLADGSALAPDLVLASPTPIAGGADPRITYEVSILDEDDPDRVDATSLDDDADASNDEDGNALTDNNLVLVVQAVGHGPNDAKVTLEALIGPLDLPAIVTDGDLDISGNPEIGGMGGGVQSNADLSISGNPEIALDAAASGDYSSTGHPTIGGDIVEGAKELPLPSVSASGYLTSADFILNATGQLTQPDGTALCDASGDANACRAMYGWVFDGDGWRISGNSAADGTFYVEGAARISGNPGDDDDPLRITILAEGSIEISGNPVLTPDTTELLFVTDGDLRISGNFEMASAAPGQMLVHEQLSINGNPEIFGQIIVEDAATTDSLVTANSIHGNPEITYDGNLGTNVFVVAGWREIR